MTYTITIDGVQYGTGLQLPERRETQFKAYSSQYRVLDEKVIHGLIAFPNRLTGRKRFGPEWIKNQQNLGACNGFAGASCLEKSRVNRGLPRVKLSGFGLYSAINGGRDQGSMLEDGMKWMTENGCPVELDNERPEYRWRNISQASKEPMGQYKAAECFHIQSEVELASALAQGFLCVAAVHATDRWSQQDKDGVSLESLGVGNHAGHIDDVILLPSGEYAFDFANSWTARWGTQGRTYITWKRHLRSTVENHYFYAISTTSDGKGNSPPEIKK